MTKNLITEMQEIADVEFKALADTLDKHQQFSKSAIEKVNRDLIISLMCAGTSFNETLNPGAEAEIYFYATKYCANIRNYFLVTCGMVGSTVCKFGTADQKSHLLNYVGTNKKLIASLAITESDGGSDHNSMTCNYRLMDNGYILNGAKSWITFGGIADYFLVAASGASGIGVFVVDGHAQGLTRSEHSGLLCSRASHLSQLSFDDVLVDNGSLLGGGFEESRAALGYALNVGRAISAISGVGLAAAALDVMVQFCRKRRQFGVRICDHQMIQDVIAECSVELLASKLMAVNAFEALRMEASDYTSRCAIAKYKSSLVAQQVTEKAMQSVGAIGVSADMPLERYFREARAFHYIEGTEQILKQLIARQRILGVPQLWGHD